MQDLEKSGWKLLASNKKELAKAHPFKPAPICDGASIRRYVCLQGQIQRQAFGLLSFDHCTILLKDAQVECLDILGRNMLVDIANDRHKKLRLTCRNG